MKLIQLQGVDGQDVALFQYDPEKLNEEVAIDAIEVTIANFRDEDDPLEMAEEELQEEFGITRVYVTIATTDVL